MNDQSTYDPYDLDNEEDLDVEQEALRTQIMEGFPDQIDDEVPALLETYRKKYGSDLFWQLSSFDLAEAHQDFKTMGKILPLMREEGLSPVTFQVNSARYFYTKGDFEGAMEELKPITNLEDNEEALMYLNMRGVVAFVLQDYSEAVRCLEDMLLDIKDDQALAMAGLSYVHLGNAQRAREYLLPFATKNHPLGIMWLYEFILTFEQLDLLKDPNFPQELYARLEEEGFGFLFSTFGLEQLEEIVQHDPDFFLPILEKLAKAYPNLEVPAYFAGLSAYLLQDLPKARRWFRKVLLMPIGEDSTFQTAHYSSVFLKLICLDYLSYSAPVESRYCRDFWKWADEHHEESAIIDLIRFCGRSESSYTVITSMLNEDQLPVPNNALEAIKLHTGLLWYYYRLNDILSALEQAKHLYKHQMINDAFTLWLVGWIFFYFDHDSFVVNNDPHHYESLDTFIIDQLIALEYDLRNGEYDHAMTRLRTLESLHNSEDSEAWHLFDSLLPLLQLDVGPKPAFQKYITHLMTAFLYNAS